MTTAKQFRQQIAKSFNLNELEQLAFALGIDWDELDGRTKSNKIQSLITYCQRHKLLPQLITTLCQERSAEQWPDATELATTLTTTTAADPQGRNRQNILNNIHYTWIEGVLEPALHHDIVLALGLTYQHDAINRPHRSLYPEEQPIPPQMTISEIFAARGRALLILGQPASGKTIALLQLLQELLTAAQADPAQPIPIVLNLSSWARERAALTDWIVEELLVQYQAPRQLSRDWLAGDQLTLLLDGLDEVAAAHRDACVEAINAFKADHATDMVVCSRLADYEHLQARLNLSAAIRIQPLTTTQIDDYLAGFGPPLADLRQAVAADDEWRELAQSPLMLNLMALTYSEAPLPEGVTLTDKRQQLVAAYVRRACNNRPLPADNPYDEYQALHWLHNLGRQLQQHDQSVFYLERLQPTWLPRSRSYPWLSGLSIGLISGLIVGVISGLINGQIFVFSNGITRGLTIGLIFGLIVSLIFRIIEGDKQYVVLIEGVQWRLPSFSLILRKIIERAVDGLRVSLSVGSFIGALWGAIICLVIVLHNGQDAVGGLPIIFKLIFGLISGLVSWLFVVIIILGPGSVLGGIIGGLEAFIKTSETRQRLQPNQGIRTSWRNAYRTGFTYGLLFTLLFGLVFGLLGAILGRGLVIGGETFWTINDVSVEVIDALVMGLRVGLIVGSGLGMLAGLTFGLVRFGGRAVVQHYVLRWLLARQGVLPFPFRDRDLIAYLDAMAARLLLRRVGGGWMFIHRTLLEFFADETEFQKLINDL